MPFPQNSPVSTSLCQAKFYSYKFRGNFLSFQITVPQKTYTAFLPGLNNSLEKWFHYLRSLQLVVTGNNAEHEDFILSVRDLYEDSHLVRPPPSHKVPKMILTVLHFFTSQERAWRGRWWYSPIQKNLDTSSILPHFIWHLIIQLYLLKSSLIF